MTGDIHGDEVTVGETGKVTGSVNARNLTVHGAINGQLRAETVALHNTARISGDIVQKNLIIAEGAQSMAVCAAPRMQAIGSRCSTSKPIATRSAKPSLAPAAGSPEGSRRRDLRKFKLSSCRDP